MLKESKNYAFIDGQNLYLAIQGLGWQLEYKRKEPQADGTA